MITAFTSSVRALVEGGAKLDDLDTMYHATPLGWADYGKYEDIAAFLRPKTHI